jgi:hypothetical protein
MCPSKPEEGKLDARISVITPAVNVLERWRQGDGAAWPR